MYYFTDDSPLFVWDFHAFPIVNHTSAIQGSRGRERDLFELQTIEEKSPG